MKLGISYLTKDFVFLLHNLSDIIKLRAGAQLQKCSMLAITATIFDCNLKFACIKNCERTSEFHSNQVKIFEKMAVGHFQRKIKEDLVSSSQAGLRFLTFRSPLIGPLGETFTEKFQHCFRVF